MRGFDGRVHVKIVACAQGEEIVAGKHSGYALKNSSFITIRYAERPLTKPVRVTKGKE